LWKTRSLWVQRNEKVRVLLRKQPRLSRHKNVSAMREEQDDVGCDSNGALE
jgi:hypothetical protein